MKLQIKHTALIESLIRSMTLREKLGQMTQLIASFYSKSEAEITGPVQSFGIRTDDLKNIGSILNFKDAAEAIAIQDKHLSEDPHGIPMLFMMDVIHGYRTVFPIPLGMGASFDPALFAECSGMAAAEASASGVHVTFAPMVDFVRDARWGRVMETCGEDVLLNSRMGAAQVSGFQGDDLSDPDHIAACVKHFAAYGGAEAGRDYNTVEISERLLREYYLPAYRACLDAGAAMIMSSFNSLNGIPSVASRFLMRQILRDEWNFDGVVISDYNAIRELKTHGIADNDRDCAALALGNGCDIEMMSPTYLNEAEALVAEGKVKPEQIDNAVREILELKDALGLFDDPYHGASAEREQSLHLSAKHRGIARRAAEESAVLLKNNGVLPLSEKCGTIAVIGPFADEHAIIGSWHCNGRDEESVTVAEGIRNLLPEANILVAKGCPADCHSTDTSGFEEAVKAARNADAVVLCLGEPYGYSGEGNSRAKLDLPGMQEELAKEIVKVNPDTAALIFSGRPLSLTGLDEVLPAVMEMWFPGTEGGNAAADLLFGRVNPCGKVPMSFPRSVGQCPIYYDHPSTGRPKSKDRPDTKHILYCSNYIDEGNLPLYPFGHGLSYSDFVYEKLELDTHELTADGRINIAVTLFNNSGRDGKETVMLYIRDLTASVVRPVQSLVDFEKVTLNAGERKTVRFTLTEPQLRFCDFNCNFISEPGKFDLFVGHADHPILTDSFVLR